MRERVDWGQKTGRVIFAWESRLKNLDRRTWTGMKSGRRVLFAFTLPIQTKQSSFMKKLTFSTLFLPFIHLFSPVSTFFLSFHPPRLSSHFFHDFTRIAVATSGKSFCIFKNISNIISHTSITVIAFSIPLLLPYPRWMCWPPVCQTQHQAQYRIVFFFDFNLA